MPLFLINSVALRVGGGLAAARSLLSRLPHLDARSRYIVLTSQAAGLESLCGSCAGCHTYPWEHWSRLRQFLFNVITVPRLCHHYKADALFSLGNFPSLRTGCPQLVRFANARYLYPKVTLSLSSSIWQKLRFLIERRYLSASLPSCTIIVQTHTMKNRLQAHFALNRANILVVPNAFDPSRYTDQLPKYFVEIEPRLNNRLPLLCCARAYAHKNLHVFTKVADILEQRSPNTFILITTFAAADSPTAKSLYRQIPNASEYYSGPIVNLGPIAPEHSLVLHRRAWACILPTLLESFSGTYLEAMATARPILTSDRDFAREVCGNAALYFDPLDPCSIARAVMALYESPELWKSLSRAAEHRHRSYVRTWDDVTRDIVTILHRLAARMHDRASGF